VTELGLAGTAAIALLASNPIGWAVAAGATLFGWFSGRRRRRAAKEAEARAAKVRGTARALVRKAADELYIGVRDDFWRAVHEAATHVARELLSGRSELLCASVDDLANLTAASSILSECRPNTDAEEASAILQAAVARLRDGTRPDLTGAELLLGLDGSTSPPDARSLDEIDTLHNELTRRARVRQRQRHPGEGIRELVLKDDKGALSGQLCGAGSRLQCGKKLFGCHGPTSGEYLACGFFGGFVEVRAMGREMDRHQLACRALQLPVPGHRREEVRTTILQRAQLAASGHVGSRPAASLGGLPASCAGTDDGQSLCHNPTGLGEVSSRLLRATLHGRTAFTHDGKYVLAYGLSAQPRGVLS
jgi:hypothetical protein